MLVHAHLTFRSLWKPCAERTQLHSCCAAVFMGICGGFLPPFSPLWFLWLLLILCTRVYLPLCILAYALTLPLAWLLSRLCMWLGARVLYSAPTLWSNLLARPGVRLLDLHYSRTMGGLCLGIIAGIGVSLVVYSVLRARVTYPLPPTS